MVDEWGQEERRRRLEQRARFEDVRADIAARLRRVCADMAPSEFEALVARMARVQIKYEPGSAVWSRTGDL